MAQSYTHFTPEERKSLQKSYTEGKTIREIAKKLNRNPSSISRELKRNYSQKSIYNWWWAETIYNQRRKKCRRHFRLNESTEKKFVADCLQKFWSPEIIVNCWKLENKPPAFSTIYKAVRAGLFEEFDVTSFKNLRRRGKRKNTRNSQTIHPEKTIHDRPKIIENRERLGDLEGDTVYGAIGKGAAVTLVDRKSRMLYSKIIASRDSEITENAIYSAVLEQDIKSITFDNGSEFARFKEIEKTLKADIYFADPHSPWQRGSNENINDVFRFFFPKGTNFLEVTDEKLQYVVNLINNRPRKILGWLSPIEFFQKCCT